MPHRVLIPSEPITIREDLLKRRHQIHLDNLAGFNAIEKKGFGKVKTFSLAENFHYLTLLRGIKS